jgi:hypothetical protein
MSTQRYHKYMPIWLLLGISAAGAPTIAQAEVHVEGAAAAIHQGYHTGRPVRLRDAVQSAIPLVGSAGRKCQQRLFGLPDARHFTPARWLRLRNLLRSRKNRARRFGQAWRSASAGPKAGNCTRSPNGSRISSG